jgi:hypothetical protein
MVRYQRRHREPGWQGRMAVNLVGAIATGIVLTVVVVSKFTVGAWLPAVVIPMIVVLFKAIGHHYADDAEANELAEQWAKHDIPVELHTLTSPYRNLTRPVLRFLDELDAEDRDDIITVVIPEFVVNRWYLQVLHNQTALALKARLLFRPNTVVTSVPIHIGEPLPD